MNTLTKTTIPTIDCQELLSLLTCALDYGYNFCLADELTICNPIDGDVYYDEIVSALLDGRDIVFKDKADSSIKNLTYGGLLHAAFEFAQEYPKIYSRIGGEDGCIPQVGLRILLVALYGWARVATDIGERFSNFIKLN